MTSLIRTSARAKLQTGGMIIDEDLVERDADILVGVPCYKDGAMVDRCLRSLRDPAAQLLIVDNGSGPDVKAAIAGQGIVIRNEQNRYVNPAWNQVMEFFLARLDRYDLLVLANSDLVLDADWATKLRRHRAADPRDQLMFGKAADDSSMGAFFAMTAAVVRAVWPIPDDLLIYGGDDFIFEVNRRVGFAETVIESLTMFHEVSGTISKSPELWEIGRRDNQRWHHHVLPNLVPIRVENIIRGRGTSS
jgi:GT2 family glycosyltransferase